MINTSTYNTKNLINKLHNLRPMQNCADAVFDGTVFSKTVSSNKHRLSRATALVFTSL